MARPVYLKDGEPSKIYLNKSLKKEAKRLASERYGISLSELIRRLLVEETKHANGRVHVRPKCLCP